MTVSALAIRQKHPLANCQPTLSLNAAIKLMAKNRIRHLVVMDNTRPVAVIGIRELLAAAHEEDMLEKHVLRDLVTAGR